MGNGAMGLCPTIEKFRTYTTEYDKLRSAGLTTDEIYLIMRSRTDPTAASGDGSNSNATMVPATWHNRTDIENNNLGIVNHRAENKREIGSAFEEGKISETGYGGKESVLRVPASAVEPERFPNRESFAASFFRPASTSVPTFTGYSKPDVNANRKPAGPFAARTQVFSMKKPLALLIDDSAVAARVAAKTLSLNNFEVISANSARKGYDLLVTRSSDIDIVFLDVVMPEVDGVECLGWIKDNGDVDHIPVYMLSGLEDNMLAEVCIERGAEMMLLKPLNVSIIEEIVRMHGLKPDNTVVQPMVDLRVSEQASPNIYINDWKTPIRISDQVKGTSGSTEDERFPERGSSEIPLSIRDTKSHNLTSSADSDQQQQAMQPGSNESQGASVHHHHQQQHQQVGSSNQKQEMRNANSQLGATTGQAIELSQQQIAPSKISDEETVETEESSEESEENIEVLSCTKPEIFVGGKVPGFTLRCSDSTDYIYPNPSSNAGTRAAGGSVMDGLVLLIFLPTINFPVLHSPQGIMRVLIRQYSQLSGKGVEVYSISGDSTFVLSAARGKNDIPFRMLSDPKLTISALCAGTIDIAGFMTKPKNEKPSKRRSISRSVSDDEDPNHSFQLREKSFVGANLSLLLLNANHDVLGHWLASSSKFQQQTRSGNAVDGRGIAKASSASDAGSLLPARFSPPRRAEDFCSFPTDIFEWTKQCIVEHQRTKKNPHLVVSDPLGPVTVATGGRKDGKVAQPSGLGPDSATVGASNHPTTSKKQSLNVLVIDDSSVSSRIAQKKLEGMGHKVVCKYDGNQGFEALSTSAPGRFDIVLVDVIMPVCDGLEFLRMVQKETRLKGVPIAMMSGLDGAEIAKDCKRLGACALLAKPFDVDEFRNVLKSCDLV